ncbi:MAG: nucleotide-binding domain containing protein, partial [Dehalococcoidia bacterium]
GVPVTDTDVGQDQLSPLPSSRVEEIVLAALDRAGIGEQVHVRGHNDGRSVSDLLPVIITADAQTEDDLKILAERLIGAKATAFVAGSAGVSVALADALGDSRSGRHSQTRSLLAVGRTLIVTASQRAVVDEQIKRLGDQINLAQIDISVDEMVQGIGSDSMDRITGLTARERVVVLKVGKLAPGGDLPTGDVRVMADTIVRNLGQVVRIISDTSSPDVLISIGGDTTSGVLNACDVTSLELQGELQPGTVSGIPADGSIADTLLITRAGGFGDKNALLQLVSILEFGHSV